MSLTGCVAMLLSTGLMALYSSTEALQFVMGIVCATMAFMTFGVFYSAVKETIELKKKALSLEELRLRLELKHAKEQGVKQKTLEPRNKG